MPRIHHMHRVNRSDSVRHQTVSRVDGAPWILTSHEEGPFRVWKNAIAEKSREWQSPHVNYYNGRDGSGRPQKDCKGMLWEGITFRDTNKAPWNKGRVGR